MPATKLSIFFKKYPEIEYARGEKILRPNEYAEHMYYIKSGYIKLYKLFKSGQEISISTYNPKKQKNLVFGYTPLLAEYYVEAFTDVVLYRAPKKDFDTFISNNQDVREYLLHEFYITFEELLRQVEWLSIPDAYTRIKAVLYSLGRRIGCKEHGKVILDSSGELEVKITHQLIANFSGLSRETVTIQINKLIEDGYLSRVDGKLAIENLDTLVEDL